MLRVSFGNQGNSWLQLSYISAHFLNFHNLVFPRPPPPTTARILEVL